MLCLLFMLLYRTIAKGCANEIRRFFFYSITFYSMSKKPSPSRRSQNSSVGNKRKKLVQTTLDLHFWTSGRPSSSMEEGKQESGPSNSERDVQKEKLSTAALIRATSSAEEDVPSNDEKQTSVVDLSDSPLGHEFLSNHDDEPSKNTTSGLLKSRWWDNEDKNSQEQTPDCVPATPESPDDSRIMFLGPPLVSLRKPTIPLGKLSSNDCHTILFNTSTLENTRNGRPPSPYPRHYYDKWDNNHVRIPCSSQNEYPVNETELVKRWDLVQKALSGTFTTFNDLKTSIMSYNDRYADKWNFSGLENYIENMEVEERDALFSITLPKMAQLALKLPEIVTHPIPLLKRGMQHTISMTQQQAACLLANAFFCTFPRRNQRRNGSEYGSYPEINFNGIFGQGRVRNAKLDLILHYFRRVTTRMPEGVVSFERFSLDTFPDWSTSRAGLTKLHVSCKGTIEDFGDGMLQVDFANKFLGGGVLRGGAVQEEIRFLICPESIISMLFTEVLAPNECLIMNGCERFSYYTGYANSLQWLQSFEDTTPRDEWGRRRVEIVAIDALPFSKALDQFKEDKINRELNKAYCGFARPGIDTKYLSPVATGNWGCGAFGGDKELKSLVQLMAAAEAGRDMVYFTFDDNALMKRIYDMYEFLISRKCDIASIYIQLMDYCDHVENSPKNAISLFDFIYQNV